MKNKKRNKKTSIFLRTIQRKNKKEARNMRQMIFFYIFTMASTQIGCKWWWQLFFLFSNTFVWQFGVEF